MIMQIERRALYNSLRMNWLLDPTMDIEPWQVQDYRAFPISELFKRLKEKEIDLDRTSFIALADNMDTPEELTDQLLNDSELNNTEQDQIYLLFFELWRRFVPEKQSLSIFCDELDHQIHLYDQNQLKSTEAIQDVLANLIIILDENTDQGISAAEAFESISAACANDLESFLYDFTAEQIDNNNYSYASDLIDNFSTYVRDTKWFDFLKARIQFISDPSKANKAVRSLMEKAISEKDLTFNLELLTFMAQAAEQDTFVFLVKQTIPLLEIEEDALDLLVVCADFFHRLDQENEEKAIQNIIKKRSKNNPEKPFKPNDSDLTELLRIIS